MIIHNGVVKIHANKSWIGSEKVDSMMDIYRYAYQRTQKNKNKLEGIFFNDNIGSNSLENIFQK